MDLGRLMHNRAHAMRLDDAPYEKGNACYRDHDRFYSEQMSAEER